MLDDKEKLLEKNNLFRIRRNSKALSAYESAKRFYFAFSIVFSLLLIGLVYFLSDLSNIYRITVTGNEYLKSEEIIELSGLSDQNKFLLVFPSKIEKKLKTNSLIEDADVSLHDGKLVEISVKEKKIVAYAPENGMSVLILEDGERIGLSRQEMYLIANAPFVEGFNEEEMATLIRWLSHCERKIIGEISEIHKYPELKYQDVELIMRDGNYIFTSVYGMDILNHYFDMRSSYASTQRSCYYFEDISGNAYTSACPWEEVEEEIVEEDTVEEEEDE